MGARMRVVTIFAGGRDMVVGFPAAARIRTARHLPTITAWRALRQVDALVISGGGLINDYWPAVIPRYVAWCRGRTARRLPGDLDRSRCRPDPPTPLAVVGRPGVSGQPRRPRPGSGVRRLGPALLSRGTVRVIADPAFFLPVAPAADATPNGVAIVARGPTPVDAALTDDFVRSLATARHGHAGAG